MPKSIISIDETIKTGAAIGFLALERFNAGKLIREKLAAENGNANLLNPDSPFEATPAQILEIRENSLLLPKYMVSMFEINKVVYCRYGRDYIPNVAK